MSPTELRQKDSNNGQMVASEGLLPSGTDSMLALPGPVDKFVEGFEAPAATGAEHLPGHNLDELAEFRMKLDPAHNAADTAEAEAVDSDFGQRTKGEQALVETVVDEGRFVLGEMGIDPPLAKRPRRRWTGLVDEVGGQEVTTLDAPKALAVDIYPTRKPQNKFEAVLMNRVEANRPVIEKALERLPYQPTSEVREAVSGFYNDNDILLVAVEGYSRGLRTLPVPGEEFISHPILARAMTEFSSSGGAGRTQEADALAKDILDSLYRECSLGAQTLADAEIEKRVNIIVQTYKNMGIEKDANDVLSSIKYARAGSEKEVRYAGQPLFHNTPNVISIIGDGHKVMSRTAQTAQKGVAVATTGGYELAGNAHSNVPHFSEMYDPSSYRCYKNRKTGATEEYTGGCIAIPIADVIETAPYARNGLYGVVKAKEGVLVPFADKGCDLFTEYNNGAYDVPGQWLGLDRVFHASASSDKIKEGHDYVIEAAKIHPSPYNTGETTSTIIIADYDVSPRYQKTFYGDVIKDRIGPAFGSGYGLPVIVRIPTPEVETEVFRGSGLTPDLVALSRETVMGVVRKSIENPIYKDEYVVPLRGNIMEYTTEGDLWTGAKMTPLQKRYCVDGSFANDVSRIRYAR